MPKSAWISTSSSSSSIAWSSFFLVKIAAMPSRELVRGAPEPVAKPLQPTWLSAAASLGGSISGGPGDSGSGRAARGKRARCRTGARKRLGFSLGHQAAVRSGSPIKPVGRNADNAHRDDLARGVAGHRDRHELLGAAEPVALDQYRFDRRRPGSEQNLLYCWSPEARSLRGPRLADGPRDLRHLRRRRALARD